MLLAFSAMWVGQSATMELSGNHRRGCHATSMEGVCHGEACHRIEAMLHVRDGCAREDDHGQGHRQEHGRDRHEALRRRAGALGDRVLDASQASGPLTCIVFSDTHARGTNPLECNETTTKGRRTWPFAKSRL